MKFLKSVLSLILTLFFCCSCSSPAICKECTQLTADSTNKIDGMIKNKESFILIVGLKGCGACEKYYPLIDEVAKKYDDISFYQVYYDYLFATVPELEQLMLMKCLDCSSNLAYPITCYFIKGVLTDLELGILTIEELEKMVVMFILQNVED